jgi:Tol biopolymer transport system component
MLAELILAMQVAGAGAQRVLPAASDTAADEYGPTLTADGRTMYFTLRANRQGHENIVLSRFDGKKWSKPALARFSGAGLDKEPYLSPDGSMLFFASRREYPSKIPAQGEEAYDLFVVHRHGSGWGIPEPLVGANSGAYDNYPAVSASGTVYFASHRPGGKGGNDLWRSRRVGGGWQAAENLAELNTSATDADPYIAPDESYIIFSSSRPGGVGEGDLYVSFQRGGHWTTPVEVGPAVNTATYEYTPWVTSDGKWLYFSRGWGEIWRIEMASLPALSDITSAHPKDSTNSKRR